MLKVFVTIESIVTKECTRQGNQSNNTILAVTSRQQKERKELSRSGSMSTLITNLPAYEVWVRKEYLTDHKSGHGEFVKGVWVSAKSIQKPCVLF